MDKVIIYNPTDGAEINDIYAKRTWKHEVNTLKKYPAELADYLLKKYGFLQKVHPDRLAEVKQIMKKIYSCDIEGCDYTADTEEKVRLHKLGKHKLTKEKQEELDSIEDAIPDGELQPNKPEKELSIEEQEGIPDTKKGEKAGWYGQGLEADKIGSGMIKRNIPNKTRGSFGASPAEL